MIFYEGGTEGAVELRKELAMLRLRVETLEIELKTKDEDIKRLTGPKTPHEERCKVNFFRNNFEVWFIFQPFIMN